MLSLQCYWARFPEQLQRHASGLEGTFGTGSPSVPEAEARSTILRALCELAAKTEIDDQAIGDQTGSNLFGRDTEFAGLMGSVGSITHDLILFGDRKTRHHLIYWMARSGRHQFLDKWLEHIGTSRLEHKATGYWKHVMLGLLQMASPDQQADPNYSECLIRARRNLTSTDQFWLMIKAKQYLLADKISKSSPLGVLTTRRLEYICSLENDDIWTAALRYDCSQMPIGSPLWAILECSQAKREDAVGGKFLFKHAIQSQDGGVKLAQAIAGTNRCYLLANQCLTNQKYPLLKMIIAHGELNQRLVIDRMFQYQNLLPKNISDALGILEIALDDNECQLLWSTWIWSNFAKAAMVEHTRNSAVSYHRVAGCSQLVASQYSLQFEEKYPRIPVNDPGLEHQRIQYARLNEGPRSQERTIVEIQRNGWYIYIWTGIHQSSCIVEIADDQPSEPYLSGAILTRFLSERPPIKRAKSARSVVV